MRERFGIVAEIDADLLQHDLGIVLDELELVGRERARRAGCCGWMKSGLLDGVPEVRAARRASAPPRARRPVGGGLDIGHGRDLLRKSHLAG